MSSTPNCATLELPQGIFSCFGYPAILVSDSGRQFVSERFEKFCTRRGIRQITSAPYVPQSNGQAERLFYTFQRNFKKYSGSWQNRMSQLHEFLTQYRTTSHAVTKLSSLDMLLGRRIRVASICFTIRDFRI